MNKKVREDDVQSKRKVQEDAPKGRDNKGELHEQSQMANATAQCAVHIQTESKVLL